MVAALSELASLARAPERERFRQRLGVQRELARARARVVVLPERAATEAAAKAPRMVPTSRPAVARYRPSVLPPPDLTADRDVDPYQAFPPAEVLPFGSERPPGKLSQ